MSEKTVSESMHMSDEVDTLFVPSLVIHSWVAGSESPSPTPPSEFHVKDIKYGQNVYEPPEETKSETPRAPV